MAAVARGRGGGRFVRDGATEEERIAAGSFSKNGTENGPFTLPHFRAWASRLILDTGKNWELELFQEAFVRDLFSGVREAWLVLPEGNAKTTLVAGIALYYLEHQPDADIPIAAGSRQQAEILFRQAYKFVINTPELHDDFECLPGIRIIRYLCGSEGQIKIWAADDRTADGAIPTLAICEELHRHKNLDLYQTWYGKLGKRNGQMIVISTAGDPESEFEQLRMEMLTGGETIEHQGSFTRAISPLYAIHDWAVPVGADYEDLEVVKKANPLAAITLDYLAQKRAAPNWNLPRWKRFVCNVATYSEETAIQQGEWDRAWSKERIPKNAPVWLGLDVGWKTDTTALVPMWVKNAKFRLLGQATILAAPPDGTSLHPSTIKKAVRDLQTEHPIVKVIMDVFGARDVAAALREEFGLDVVEHSQEPAQGALDYERFMAALRGAELWHTGDADLSRHVLGAVARLSSTSGKVRFERMRRSRRGAHDSERRIQPNDALIAAAMANSAYMAPNAEANKPKWGLLA